MPPAASTKRSSRRVVEPPKPLADWEIAFLQANGNRDRGVSPGELLNLLKQVNSTAPDIFAECFLILDTDGDGRISKVEWSKAYKRCSLPYGLRPKPESAGQPTPPPSGIEDEAQALLKPKIEMLQAAFDLLDLDKDGKIGTRELVAFQAVLEKRARAEALEALLAEAPPPPEGKGEKAPPPPSAASVQLDKRTQDMVSINVEQTLSELYETQLREDNGYSEAMALDFAHFKSLLMRHAAALQASAAAAAGGGKKGKKKK